MPILALFTAPMTKPQYDTLFHEIHWHKDQPPGALCHVSSFDESGHIHVADVWETVEHLNAFVQNRLMPVMMKHNIPAPDVQIFPTHLIQAYKGMDKFKI